MWASKVWRDTELVDKTIILEGIMRLLNDNDQLSQKFLASKVSRDTELMDEILLSWKELCNYYMTMINYLRNCVHPKYPETLNWSVKIFYHGRNYSITIWQFLIISEIVSIESIEGHWFDSQNSITWEGIMQLLYDND